MFLTEVNGFAYSHSEELGNAFEYLLQCTGAQSENGQFRTPHHIIDFIVACLDPQPGDKIIDPACGTGGFLVSAYRHILAQQTSSDKSRSSGRESAPIKSSQKSEPTHVGCYSSAVTPGDLLTFSQRQQVYKDLAGYDVDDQMVKLSKVNLFLHGFPDPAIHIYDTLSNDARWHEKADLILANPPFMTPKGGGAKYSNTKSPCHPCRSNVVSWRSWTRRRRRWIRCVRCSPASRPKSSTPSPSAEVKARKLQNCFQNC